MSIASAVRPWARPRRRIGWTGRSPFVVLSVLLVVSSLAAVGPAPRPAAAAPATTTTGLNMREGPGTEYAVILVIPAGAAVNIVQNLQNGFYKVDYNGTTGWSSAQYLDRSGGGAPAPAPGGGGAGTATVSSALNLRAEPSTGAQILDVMPGGATVTLTGESANGFLGVVYNGMWGWAAAQYLGDGGSPAPAPGGTGTATTTSALNLRAGPSTGDAVLAVMPAGASVTLTGSSSNGFQSVSYNGTSGWAAAQYLSAGGSPAPSPGGGGTSATTTSALNLRAGPSTGQAVVAVMPGGAAITVTGDPQGGFYPVTYNGTSGWASGDYISFGGGGDPGGGGGSGIIFPFSGGTWSVIQGHNGGTHQNRSGFAQYYYALDWARTDGNTAGQPIYAPASGTVGFNDAGSGGLAIEMGNGYTVAMFHVTFDAGGLGYGQRVTQGQYLGYISGPGGAGYASTPHVDMTLWQGSGQSHSAAPFTGANAISGVSFPDIGGWNQHYGLTVSP